MRNLVVVWVAAVLAATGVEAERKPFSDQRAGFTLRARGELIPYRTFGLFVLPGETVEVSIVEKAKRQGSRLTSSWQGLSEAGRGQWKGAAPTDPGVYTARVDAGGDGIDLNVFVLVPATETRRESLRGYRIGSYPQKAYRGLASYRPPRGFVEVTPENQHLPVSPHFTLGQFLCKQEDGYPKFVVLRERMLLKLEHLLGLVNRRGIPAGTFFVMSGYRTPSYNAAIGNVRYSRHQYGDAADIFIDENPRDGVMDDLNGDGRVNAADADYLYDLIDADSRREREDAGLLVGGLGSYGTTRAHGPFVHVDARGFRARWGR